MNSAQSETEGEGALAADLTLVTAPPQDPLAAPHVPRLQWPGALEPVVSALGVLRDGGSPTLINRPLFS